MQPAGAAVVAGKFAGGVTIGTGFDRCVVGRDGAGAAGVHQVSTGVVVVAGDRISTGVTDRAGAVEEDPAG